MSDFFPVDLPRRAPPEYASFGDAVRVQEIFLDDAREHFEIPVSANFVWVVDASDVTATATIQLNNQSSRGFPIRRGSFIGGIALNRIYVTHAAQANKSLLILTGLEMPGNFVRVENPDLFANLISLTRGAAIDTPIVTVNPTTNTQLLPAVNTRRSAVIYNPSMADTLYIGQTGITNLTGFPIPPESSFRVDQAPEAALFGYHTGAAAIDVPIFEESD